MTSYTIERLYGRDWIAVGNARTSFGAQIYMRDWQAMNPTAAYRVVEEPSRRIVVLHDPVEDRS